MGVEHARLMAGDALGGMGGAMCIAGSKGHRIKSPIAWIRARAQRREHASTSQGRITRGRARGAPSLASKTRRTKTAAIRRRRARGRESGAGKGVQGMCARACGWLLGLFVDSYNPFHTESHRSHRPPSSAPLLLAAPFFAIHSIAYHGDESRPCGRARAGAATATDA